MDEWKAFVADDTFGDPFGGRVRLYVRQRFGTHMQWLSGDGVLHTIEEGTAPPETAGIVIPRAAVEAIAIAIEQWQGHASHADTEARVLREWLAVEQRRVDDALSR